MRVIKKVPSTKEYSCPKGCINKNNLPIIASAYAIGMQYCPFCGSKIEPKIPMIIQEVCSRCDNWVASNWNYCMHCGEMCD